MKKLFTILICTPWLLCGCSTTNITKLVKALASDPATVHLRVTTIYGTIELDRTAPRTNTLQHTVKDGTISVGQ